MKNKKIIIPIIIIALAGIGVGVYLATNGNNADDKQNTSAKIKPTNTVDYSPAKKSDNTANEDRKNSGSVDATLNTPSTPPAFSATISRANASGSSITAAATVNGTTSGTCVFTFSRTATGSSEVSSQSSPVQASNQSAICPPVTTTMPSSGNWYVHVKVTDNNQTVSADWAANPVAL